MKVISLFSYSIVDENGSIYIENLSQEELISCCEKNNVKIIDYLGIQDDGLFHVTIQNPKSEEDKDILRSRFMIWEWKNNKLAEEKVIDDVVYSDCLLEDLGILPSAKVYNFNKRNNC